MHHEKVFTCDDNNHDTSAFMTSSAAKTFGSPVSSNSKKVLAKLEVIFDRAWNRVNSFAAVVEIPHLLPVGGNLVTLPKSRERE